MPDRPTALFLDIGGVLATNGWDRRMRLRAADRFDLDFNEFDERHHLIFDAYELGRLSLDDYLERVVFYEPRPFSREAFKSFMFAQSQPLPAMLDLVGQLKTSYRLRTAAISNEGRELSEYRIEALRLARFVDFFVCSCFVHCRKPDEEIYRMALDIGQVLPEQTIYIDDRPMFVEAARSMGMHGIHHQSVETTRASLARCGLSAPRAPALEAQALRK
jgi:putative hydrolase of the HAD superfamily